MSNEDRPREVGESPTRMAAIIVPEELATDVRAYADSLLEEQRPDVEGYAILRGIGQTNLPRPGLAAKDSTTFTDYVILENGDIVFSDTD